MNPIQDHIVCAFCYKCGYTWIPRGPEVSKRCPRCHSARWDVPVIRERECRFCGLRWKMDNAGDPCPGCGRYQTECISERHLHCNQCDHDWIRKSFDMPKKCPLCRSLDWNKQKADRSMCNQCGHIWRLRSEGRPQRCPSCQSRIWDRPLKAVRCQRCGHLWKMRSPRMAEKPGVCPKCKSAKWNESPTVCLCENCSKTYYVRYGDVKRCPICHEDTDRRLIVCHECGKRWYHAGDNPGACPKCGTSVQFEMERSTSVTLWSGRDMKITYVSENGYGCVYLWKNGIPICARYIYELLNEFGMTIGQVVDSTNDKSFDEKWRVYADSMYEARDRYLKYVDYFMKRLSLSEFDARILSVHFTGMSPRMIAILFGLSEKEIDSAMGRIMSAYSESGIIVDDTVFTDDPFKFY